MLGRDGPRWSCCICLPEKNCLELLAAFSLLERLQHLFAFFCSENLRNVILGNRKLFRTEAAHQFWVQATYARSDTSILVLASCKYRTREGICRLSRSQSMGNTLMGLAIVPATPF